MQKDDSVLGTDKKGGPRRNKTRRTPAFGFRKSRERKRVGSSAERWETSCVIVGRKHYHYTNVNAFKNRSTGEKEDRAKALF